MVGAPERDQAMNDLQKQLIRHEGLRLKPYPCTSGKLTIGIGRNLEDVGITEEEAMMMFRRDVTEATVSIMRDPLWTFSDHNAARQNVLINMCFQMGKPRLDGFKKMRAALGEGDYEEAATEMLDSRWARQTPERAEELAEIMRTGQHSEP